MKILIAPNAFKECLSAEKVAIAIATGLKNASPKFKIEITNLADGGDGFLESLITISAGKIYKTQVLNPVGKKIQSQFGILNDKKTAIIELAKASGLALLNEKQKDPTITSTFGTGQLIKRALDLGCRNFIIGIGGSATNDAGTGALSALGIRLLDKNNQELPQGGIALKNLAKIDCKNIDPRIAKSKFTIACDVNNPLTGSNGASHIYGPQKGATPKEVIELDRALKNFAKIVKRDFKIDIEKTAGAGAAGGTGAGFMAFLNAKLERGFQIIAQTSNLEQKIQNADLVITAEGEINSQSTNGKVPFEVAKLCQKHQTPCIALCGRISPDYHPTLKNGLTTVFSIAPGPISLEQSMARSEYLLEDLAFRVGKLIKT